MKLIIEVMVENIGPEDPADARYSVEYQYDAPSPIVRTPEMTDKEWVDALRWEWVCGGIRLPPHPLPDAFYEKVAVIREGDRAHIFERILDELKSSWGLMGRPELTPIEEAMLRSRRLNPDVTDEESIRTLLAKEKTIFDFLTSALGEEQEIITGLANRLRDLGLTGRAIAQAAGLPESTLRNWMRTLIADETVVAEDETYSE